MVVGALAATTTMGRGRAGEAEGATPRSVGVRSAVAGLFDPSVGAALLVGSWGHSRHPGGVDGEHNGRGSTWPTQESVRGNGTSIPVVPPSKGLPGPSASTQRRTLSTQSQTDHQVLLGPGVMGSVALAMGGFPC